jgi:hypothetical protein
MSFPKDTVGFLNENGVNTKTTSDAAKKEETISQTKQSSLNLQRNSWIR